MRVWFLDYGYLDDQRLLGQHNEVHGLTTCILTGQKWGTISDRFARAVQYLEYTHERCLQEFQARQKGNHASPFPNLAELDPKFTSGEVTVTREDLIADVRSLREKWEAEGYYFGTGRLDLRIMEGEYGLPLGRSIEEAERLKQETREFLKTCPPAKAGQRIRDRLALERLRTRAAQ
jgi:hypothetical protein